MAQFNGTVKDLEKSVATTQAMADYIVEQGTVDFEAADDHLTGTWFYQIWKSGYKKCYTQVKCNDNFYVSTAWGGMYEISSSKTIFPSYPVSFTNAPNVKVDYVLADTGTQYNCLVRVGTHITAPPTVSLVCGKSVTVGHPVFTIVAEGY